MIMRSLIFAPISRTLLAQGNLAAGRFFSHVFSEQGSPYPSLLPSIVPGECLGWFLGTRQGDINCSSLPARLGGNGEFERKIRGNVRKFEGK